LAGIGIVSWGNGRARTYPALDAVEPRSTILAVTERKAAGVYEQESDVTTAATAQSSGRMGGGTVLALIAMGISMMVLAQDFSAVNVALPAIERHFDVSITTVQWVINAYTLAFGKLIVPGGLVHMFQLVGGAIGLGLTTTVVMATSNSRLSADLARLGTSISNAQAEVLHGLLAGTDAAERLLGQLDLGSRSGCESLSTTRLSRASAWGTGWMRRWRCWPSWSRLR
jgi:hypothetical protein